jgi:hypothetical protein
MVLAVLNRLLLFLFEKDTKLWIQFHLKIKKFLEVMYCSFITACELDH